MVTNLLLCLRGIPVWWEKFGLVREPNLDIFPLSVENAYLFVETHRSITFNALLSRLDDPILVLRKVYALVGTFGSGKTTIVEYIRYKFYLKSINICSINLNWKQKKIDSSDDVRSWFFEEMQKQLLRVYQENIEQDFSESIRRIFVKGVFDEDDIIDIIHEFSNYFNGFIVFIDELHREEEAKKVVFILDFLKSMQPFFTNMCRGPVAFFIACHEDWEKNFQLNKYSGIFTDTIVLPSWNSDEAHILVDKRLGDAAADKRVFKNPIHPGALEKMATLGIIKYYCPREWLIHSKRLLRDCPDGVHEITSAVISSVFSQVDIAKVEQIKQFASSDFSDSSRIIGLILDSEREEAIKLLTVLVFMYNNDLPRPITDQVCKKIGYEDLPLLIEKLKQHKIVVESRRTSPPRKVGRGAVETLYQEVYKLNTNLTTFFERGEEKFGFEPEDYLLKFIDDEVEAVGTTAVVVENEANIESMKTLLKKLVTPRAKDHLIGAIEDYNIFIGSAFSSSNLSRVVARSGDGDL